ncbi:MAG: sigma-70 family RNA polymerase sigma factor [Acetatifactor sp.]|nr:sigma-70 family RNA polymerase sigma factor [Acetatifactor sp.]
MNDTQNLKELVHNAAEGDKAAFEELYQTTCRSVYFTCLGILKDEQEAQDITQDVYLTAFEQLGSLEDAGKFRSWLYRIAANKSIKHLRKKQPILSGDEQLEDMETEENENFLPEEYALNADKRKLVLEITRKVCTDVQYQTILLYYFNELSVAEIAEIMECQESNVKKRLSIARTKIKEGVLQYEKKSGDKLHSFAVIPFLTALFTAQVQDMPMPSFPLRFTDAIPKSKLAAKAAKTGGRIMLKSLQVKIIAGIAAAVVAVGGITAAGNTENTPELGAESAEAPHEHVYKEEITKEATCEADGVKTFTCECGDSYTEVIKATGHVFDYVYNEDATYEADGTETATCKNCGVTDTRTAEGTMLTYTYTDMSATMYAQSSVNVRDLPSTDGEKLGALSINQEVSVTGQCDETGWYRFEYNGQTAYVSDNYLSDSKVEVAQAASSGGSSASTSSEPCPYTLHEWTVETTEYGWNVHVTYTTASNWESLRALGYNVPDNNSRLNDGNLSQLFAEGYHYGYHFVSYFEEVGTYAEGTVYKCSRGPHVTITTGQDVGCPDFGKVNVCRPGTVRIID